MAGKTVEFLVRPHSDGPVRLVVLATVLIVMDTNLDQEIVERWPLLFGSGAAGARDLLTTVACSMITVAGRPGKISEQTYTGTRVVCKMLIK